MKLHSNAALSIRQRNRLVMLCESGAKIAAAAREVGCSRQTGSKWVGRYRNGEGLEDRSSRPRSCPWRTPERDERRVLALRAECLRQKRPFGPHPVGWELGIPPSTCAAIFRRYAAPQPAAVKPLRYEYEELGGLVHVDIKKLRRFEAPGHALTGDRSRRSYNQRWEFVFVAVDSRSRLGFTMILPDEKTRSARRFLCQLLRFYAAQGISVKRVLTDNGACFKSRFSRACARLGIKHKRTRPYRPQTNGKAERFIKTLLGEWAYAHEYQTSMERNACLLDYLDYYNQRRRHRSLKGLTPLQIVNNVLGSHS